MSLSDEPAKEKNLNETQLKNLHKAEAWLAEGEWPTTPTSDSAKPTSDAATTTTLEEMTPLQPTIAPTSTAPVSSEKPSS